MFLKTIAKLYSHTLIPESMKPIVKQCCARWRDDEDYCQMSATEKGWGCRLLVCLPDKMHRNDRERKKLFEKVYTYPQECGVLSCPHFRESIIDEVIDDPHRLSEIVRICHRTRADLLSEDFWNKYN